MKKPFFMMLIGLPGSGKTNYAKTIGIENTVICSSDALRKELYGDESIQQSPEVIFDKLLQITKEKLSNGFNVVFDATNISRKHRINILRQLPQCYKFATIVWATYEACVERDKKRERHVGESVIKRMLCNFQPPYYDEGWDAINILLTSPEYTEKDYDDWMNCEHDNPHHNNTVKQHSMQVADLMAKKINMPTMIIAASLHDMGKKFTKVYNNTKGEKTTYAHYYNHQNVGSYFALGLATLPAEDNDVRLLISWLINVHMDPFLNTKYYRKLPPEMKHIVDLLHQCDIEGA